MRNAPCPLSALSSLRNGIYRAKTDADRLRRKAFADELARDMIVHPVSLAIAQVAGRIEGEQAARGVSIAVEDLIIGATALHLGFDVATLNVRDFQRIPGLDSDHDVRRIRSGGLLWLWCTTRYSSVRSEHPKKQLRQHAKSEQYPEHIDVFLRPSLVLACALLLKAPKKERVEKQECHATDDQESPQWGASRNHE